MSMWSEVRTRDGGWRVTPEFDVEGAADRALWAAIEPDYDTSVEGTVFELVGESTTGNHISNRVEMVPVKYGWLTRLEPRHVISASTTPRK